MVDGDWLVKYGLMMFDIVIYYIYIEIHVCVVMIRYGYLYDGHLYTFTSDNQILICILY